MSEKLEMDMSNPNQTWQSIIVERKPYVCPVCYGKGIVPNGFYLGTSDVWSTFSTEPETCHSCQGTGIVWG